MIKYPLSRTVSPLSATTVSMAALGLGVSQGALVGINFQGNAYGFGPYAPTVAAFGVPAADWVNLAPAAAGAGSHVASGLSASYSAAGSWTSFGYAYANVGAGPTTDDERVLAGNVWGDNGVPIAVTLDLGSAVSYTYSLTLIASQDSGTAFLPASVNDGLLNSTVNFTTVTQGGQWNGANTSPMSVADPLVGTTLSDTITITITGPNVAAGVRNALAGIRLDFTPVPEPGAVTLAGLAGLALLRRQRQ